MSTSTTASKTAPLVPIRTLNARHRARVTEHLLALSERDRYLRFGYPAQDAQIHAYAERLDFSRDEIFGIYNRRLELIAMAHLALCPGDTGTGGAEFGVSVASQYRGRGFGARLFARAAMHARNAGIRRMFIHALSENSAMLQIARKAGASIERDGADSQAHLLLPSPTLDSRLSELLEEQVALADYRFKLQAKHWHDAFQQVHL